MTVLRAIFERLNRLTHRDALMAALGVGLPLLFILAVLVLFMPVAALLLLLLIVIGAGLLKRSCPGFFMALRGRQDDGASVRSIKPLPPTPKNKKRTYMMLISLNAMGRQQVIVNDTPFIIGRERDCSFVIDHEQVSRHHLAITYNDADKMCYVQDSSSNGTFLNSVRIPQGEKRLLKQGDTLQIAGIIYSVDYAHF